MRAFLSAAAAVWLIPLALVGQLPGSQENDFDEDYWYDVFYPKAFFSTRDGLTVGGYVGLQQPIRFEDFGAPQPYRASISVNAQISTTGSRFVFFTARLPQFVNGWRFIGQVGARRDARDNYFGIGSDTEYDSDNVTDTNPHFYHATQTRYSARIEAQRYIAKFVRFLVGIDADRWRFQPLEDGASVFASDITVGTNSIVRTDGVTDIAFRGGVVVDTRNDEVFAERGVLVQLIGAVADPDIVGTSSYTRLMFSVQGNYPLSERLGVAGRFLAQGMGGTPGLGSMYVIDGHESRTIGFGGAGSHRGLRDNRFIGEDKLLTNFDVRYAVFSIPTLVRITAVGFLDAGRVFDDEGFKLTTDGLEVGGGGGLFAQIGRAGIVGTTTGVGPDGITFFLHTSWPF